MTPYFNDNNSFILYHGDSNIILDQLEEKVDMIFADPPYFLSNSKKRFSLERQRYATKAIGIKCVPGKKLTVLIEFGLKSVENC